VSSADESAVAVIEDMLNRRGNRLGKVAAQVSGDRGSGSFWDKHDDEMTSAKWAELAAEDQDDNEEIDSVLASLDTFSSFDKLDTSSNLEDFDPENATVYELREAIEQLNTTHSGSEWEPLFQRCLRCLAEKTLIDRSVLEFTSIVTDTCYGVLIRIDSLGIYRYFASNYYDPEGECWPWDKDFRECAKGRDEEVKEPTVGDFVEFMVEANNGLGATYFSARAALSPETLKKLYARAGSEEAFDHELYEAIRAYWERMKPAQSRDEKGSQLELGDDVHTYLAQKDDDVRNTAKDSPRLTRQTKWTEKQVLAVLRAELESKASAVVDAILEGKSVEEALANLYAYVVEAIIYGVKTQEALDATIPVFVYGTLKRAKTRKEAIGREVPVIPEVDYGERKVSVKLTGDTYPDVVRGGETKGDLMLLTSAEVKKLDRWEEKYTRRATKLADGTEAWEYVLK
jgi:gamma-glutamylcyclotransferase (GGCT)/AIG2-like uncharacterized protein YtfP